MYSYGFFVSAKLAKSTLYRNTSKVEPLMKIAKKKTTDVC